MGTDAWHVGFMTVSAFVCMHACTRIQNYALTFVFILYLMYCCPPPPATHTTGNTQEAGDQGEEEAIEDEDCEDCEEEQEGAELLALLSRKKAGRGKHQQQGRQGQKRQKRKGQQQKGQQQKGQQKKRQQEQQKQHKQQQKQLQPEQQAKGAAAADTDGDDDDDYRGGSDGGGNVGSDHTDGTAAAARLRAAQRHTEQRPAVAHDEQDTPGSFRRLQHVAAAVGATQARGAKRQHTDAAATDDAEAATNMLRAAGSTHTRKLRCLRQTGALATVAPSAAASNDLEDSPGAQLPAAEDTMEADLRELEQLFSPPLVSGTAAAARAAVGEPASAAGGGAQDSSAGMPSAAGPSDAAIQDATKRVFRGRG